MTGSPAVTGSSAAAAHHAAAASTDAAALLTSMISPRARPPHARKRKEMTLEDRTGNGHAASPRHFHHRSRPVYGLART
jgi:hypothetical protein